MMKKKFKYKFNNEINIYKFKILDKIINKIWDIHTDRHIQYKGPSHFARQLNSDKNFLFLNIHSVATFYTIITYLKIYFYVNLNGYYRVILFI